jgi:Tfp pilus assembly protein PilO
VNVSSAKHTRAASGSPWKIYAGAIVVCALLSAGSYLFGARPAIARYNENLDRQAELKTARQKAANLLGTLNSSRTQLVAVNDALHSLTLRLEPVTTINQRLSRLTALANGTELKIDEMRPGAITEASDYQTVPILIAGSGTYPACATFLRELRKTFPDTAVRSFETTNNSSSPDSPAATFQFDLVWHAAKN